MTIQDVLLITLFNIYLGVLVYGEATVYLNYRDRKRGILWGGQHVIPDGILWTIWPIIIAIAPLTRHIYRRFHR